MNIDQQMNRPEIEPLEDDLDEIEIKFTVLGDSNVGKTNLLYRYLNDSFNPNSSPTIGFDYLFKQTTKEVALSNGSSEFQVKVPILLKIFDTAGQERFRSLTKTQFNGTRGYILVYDITSRESLDNLQFWLSMIDEQSGDDRSAKKLLIGNKLDLDKKRQVTFEEGEMLAKSRDMMFAEASAKTNENECVTNAFNNFVDVVLIAMKEEIVANYQSNLESTGMRFLARIDTNKDLTYLSPADKQMKPCC